MSAVDDACDAFIVNTTSIFTGYRVVLRCMQPRLTEVTLPFQFQPNQWYHVVLTHSTGSALTSSMVRLFVNGNLEASSKFKYAKVDKHSACTVFAVQAQKTAAFTCRACFCSHHSTTHLRAIWHIH